MYKNNYPHKRYRITLDFLKTHIDTNEEILDLGVSNPFSEMMTENNYKVSNTHGEDIDVDFKKTIVLDFESRSAQVNGKNINLTSSEFRLICIFYKKIFNFLVSSSFLSINFFCLSINSTCN